MKCSFTALPASTFVQRKNNKKSHRASWTLRGFFSSFWRGGKTALDSLFVLLPCPFKGIQQPSLVVTREDLIFSHDWKSRVSVWLLWIVIVKKKKKQILTEELERFSGELFEVWSVVVFQLSWFPFHNVPYFWSSANFHFLYWAIKAEKFPSLVSLWYYFTHGYIYVIQILNFPLVMTSDIEKWLWKYSEQK